METLWRRLPRKTEVESAEVVSWLGGRDSNPDNLLQRQMSYRWTTSQHGRGRVNRAETPIIVGRFAARQARQQDRAAGGWLRPTTRTLPRLHPPGRRNPAMHAVAAEKREDLEQPWADGSAGNGHADRVDERAGLHPARLGYRA